MNGHPVKTIAYLSLGSNMGNRVENLRQALDCLKNLGTISAVSSFYETEPVDVAGPQPWFVNSVAALATELAPAELLAGTRAIEGSMGRQRKAPKAPRVLDIDIVMYGSTILNEPELALPHPEMHRRRFVLEPLAEIAPEVEHPVLHQTAAELLRALPAGAGQVRRLREDW